MATISVRVPDDLKERMDAHPEVNWSAVIRDSLAREVESRRDRDLAKAVIISERLSDSVDPEALADVDTTGIIRRFREERYGSAVRDA